MLMGYYLWVYSVIRLNARLWYNWWQRSCIVRYIPSSTVNLRYNEENQLNTPNNSPVDESNNSENCMESGTDVVIDIEGDANSPNSEREDEN